MASLLPRFYDVEEGRVTLEAVDVRTQRLRALRSHIGIVPQEPMLFAGTVRENVAYGRPGATDAEIQDVSRQVHAHEFISAFPQGYDQLVGERGVTLSAGQRQRIAIAHRLSTVIRADRILVLDGGVIVDRGNHAELLGRGPVYQRFYQRQFDDALASTREVVE